MLANSAPDGDFFWLALQQLPGVGPVLYKQLITQFGSPKAVLEADTQCLTRQGVNSQALALIAQLRHDPFTHPVGKQVSADLQRLRDEGAHLIHLHHPHYPVLLSQTYDAPPVLYVLGDPSVLNHPQVAIVGSRAATVVGRETAQHFAAHLAHQGLVITSGMALGIDASGHQGALQAQGKTIAVMGTGLDVIYPAKHRKLAQQIRSQGALVSEFALSTAPRREHFPRRNRLISGLSLGVLVVEAAPRSGSLITARMALEQGREVFAIPGSIHNPQSKGCHELLRHGAKLVETVEDILSEIRSMFDAQSRLRAEHDVLALTPDKPGETAPPLNTEAQKIYAALGYDPSPVDRIANRSGLSVDRVTAALIDLELAGHIKCCDGAYQRA